MFSSPMMEHIRRFPQEGSADFPNALNAPARATRATAAALLLSRSLVLHQRCAGAACRREEMAMKGAASREVARQTVRVTNVFNHAMAVPCLSFSRRPAAVTVVCSKVLPSFRHSKSHVKTPVCFQLQLHNASVQAFCGEDERRLSVEKCWQPTIYPAIQRDLANRSHSITF